MRTRKAVIGVLAGLGLAALIGCHRPEEVSKETREFEAEMLGDGSVRLRMIRNGRVDVETIVPSSRTSPANVITGTSFNELELAQWCVVQCHMNPSTDMVVAWDPDRDIVYCSPGYLWAIIPSAEGGALATVFRPHFNTPPDAPDSLRVNETHLCDLPAYRWRLKQANAGGMVLDGTSEQGDPMSARLTVSGRWVSSTGKTYDIYYVYHTIRMHTRHTNIRGLHRVFFVRNGEVVRAVTCSGEIVVQDNELMEHDGGAVSPWSETDAFTEGL